MPPAGAGATDKEMGDRMHRSKKFAGFGVALLLSLTLVTPAQGEWSFVRGDANGDGDFNIADPVFILGFLFSGGPGPCLDAMDVNDDGMNNIADAVAGLDSLFGAGGTSPPAPFPTCGTDPTADALDCVGPLTACPEIPSGCLTNPECPTGEYCLLPEGDCGSGMETGDCTVLPFICTAIFDPVCGCDGNTYGNACEAAAAGVNVDYTGQCVVPGCLSNPDCMGGEFCLLPVGDCGSGAQTGTCTPLPFICPAIFAPVCGCDGNTYSNDCEAAANGVNVDYTGQCVVGGCTTNTDCLAGEFCLTPIGNCGTVGTCEPLPFICSFIFDPVCGCDGVTYSNECNGWAAGVSADFSGMCP